MNKESYIEDLKSRLHSLPEEERGAAVGYYQEYLNDAGPQGEMRAIDELGPPSKVASQILAEFASGAIKMDAAESARSKKKGTGKRVSQFAALIAGILAAPVAFPLVLAAVLALLSAAVAVALLVFSIYVMCAAFIGSGAVLAVAGIYYAFENFASGVVMFGAAGVLTGMGVMLLVPARAIYFGLSRVVLNLSSHTFHRMTGEVAQ